ncbi:DEAD/DEAH box helicase, partial [Escherichia coli]|uniref:DEAD/DEAH box helicase n=2 Tax=Escherichia coli TaxID=562 RepID=UPI002022E45C
MSSAYNSLDPRVRKWVYKQGWSSLRPLQESSIPAILARDRDVLISAGTAAGKTEAFFLPACSAIADLTSGFGIIYMNRPGFPGECFICELRLPDHRFRWK